MQRCHFITWCLQAPLRGYSGASCCGNRFFSFFYMYLLRCAREHWSFSVVFPIKRYKTCSHANWNLPVKHPITLSAKGRECGTEFIAFIKFSHRVAKFISAKGKVVVIRSHTKLQRFNRCAALITIIYQSMICHLLINRLAELQFKASCTTLNIQGHRVSFRPIEVNNWPC